jgi:hypothetical protein
MKTKPSDSTLEIGGIESVPRHVLSFTEEMRIRAASQAFIKHFPITLERAKELITATVRWQHERQRPEKAEELIERWQRK